MICVFGDSHRSFFTNSHPGCSQPAELEIFRSYAVGPGTAHHFDENRLPAVVDVLRNIPKDSVILLSAGEVDCRIHLPKVHLRDGVTLKKLVQDTVVRFMQCYTYLQDMGYRVIAWGPHPTTHLEITDYKDYAGTQKLRNQSCELFNKTLEQKSHTLGIPFSTLYYDIINDDYTVKDEYYRDVLHLNHELWNTTQKRLKDIYDNYNNI